MIEDVRPEAGDLGDFVAFVSAGRHGEGSYRCADCLYGICIRGELPRCPMCGGAVWEPIGLPALLEEPARRA